MTYCSPHIVHAKEWRWLMWGTDSTQDLDSRTFTDIRQILYLFTDYDDTHCYENVEFSVFAYSSGSVWQNFVRFGFKTLCSVTSWFGLRHEFVRLQSGSGSKHYGMYQEELNSDSTLGLQVQDYRPDSSSDTHTNSDIGKIIVNGKSVFLRIFDENEWL